MACRRIKMVCARVQRLRMMHARPWHKRRCWLRLRCHQLQSDFVHDNICSGLSVHACVECAACEVCVNETYLFQLDCYMCALPRKAHAVLGGTQRIAMGLRRAPPHTLHACVSALPSRGPARTRCGGVSRTPRRSVGQHGLRVHLRAAPWSLPALHVCNAAHGAASHALHAAAEHVARGARRLDGPVAGDAEAAGWLMCASNHPADLPL